MKPPVDQKKAYLFGLATVLLWSTVASAFKISLRYLDHIQLLLYATFFSILILSAILAVQGRFGALFGFTRRQYLQSVAFGFLNPFLYYLILFKAYDLLPAQEAQPLNYTWAITLALLSIPLLGQKLSSGDVIGALVSYAGVVVISTRGDLAGFQFSNPAGVALALASTIVWALYWIYNTKDDRDPVPGLLMNFICGFPFVLAACLIFSDLWPDRPAGLLGAAYVGFFEMGVTFVLWLNALRLSVNTAKVGNLIFISPFLSLVFIRFLVGEIVFPSTYVGLVLIIAGLVVQRVRKV
jgi:drug/metabolite transporter (DMT)-like permease